MYMESPTCCLLTTARLVPCSVYAGVSYKLVLPEDIVAGDSRTYLHQYLGVRDCLCMTIAGPQSQMCLNLVSKHLPTITWLGQVSCIKKRNEYRIPQRVWAPQSGPFTGDLTLRGYAHNFISDKTRRYYTVLFFPALNRSGVVQAEYLI
jgi:hypothetical protein